MRKTIAVLLSAALLCTVMDAPYIFAADMQEETDPLCGKCGDNVFWEYDGAGTLTISGSNTMYAAFHLGHFDWAKSVTSCVIEEGVRDICDYAFEDFTALTSVTIPSSVCAIGYCAFRNCIALEQVTIPEGVEVIKESAFMDCIQLHDVTLPDSLNKIGSWCFAGCSIASFHIPRNVCSIDNFFVNYDVIETITVDPENPYYTVQGGVLYSKAMDELICYFDKAGKTSFAIPDSVMIIWPHAFFGCRQITEIQFPENLRRICSFAFNGCSGITSAVIPDGTLFIEPGAFSGCDALDTLYLPGSLTEITGPYNAGVRIVYFGGTEQQYQEIVNGKPFGEAEIVFNSDESSLSHSYLYSCDKKRHIIEKAYNPQVFVQNHKSQEYNPELAYTLAVLASGAYDYRIAQENLAALGFTTAHQGSSYFNDEVYRLTWEQEAVNYAFTDKVGFGIGQTQLENGDTLVLVVIRGTFEAPKKLLDPVLVLGNEWLSDYNVVRPTIFGSGEHTGFINAEKDVMKDLERVTGGIKTEHVKYVVTGHSRGAAVANLLEKELMDKGVSGDDVFGYNFACPDVAKEPLSQFNPDGKYDNIFNICMAGDPVSVVPGMLGDGLAQINVNNLRKAGHVWSKYGRSGWFCRDWNTVFSDNGTGFSFGKHASENYVDFMQRRCSFNESKSRLAYEAGMVTDLLTPEIPIYKNRVGLAKASYEYDDKIKQQFLDHPPMIHASFHCPVDVEITDSEGNVLASVEGDAVTYHDNTDIQVTVWKDGDEKYFTVIGREDVHFNLKGTDTGEMTAVISVQPANMMQSASVAYYENVPLTAGKQMSLDIRHDTQEYTEDIVVYDEDGAQADTVAPDLAEQPQIFGDLNSDDDLTVTDAVLLARLTAEDNVPDLEPNVMFLSDVDRDGLLTIADIQTLLTLLMCKMQG